MVDLELHMKDDVMSHINLDGFFSDLPETGDVIGAYSSTIASSSSPDSGLSWFDEIENILMKDDDVHVLAEPGAERAVPEGLELPADLRFPGPSLLASPRLLQDAAAQPQVLRQLADFLGFHGARLSWALEANDMNCFNIEFQLDLVFGDLLNERGRLLSTSSPLEDLSTRGSKCCRTCSKEGNCDHRNVFEMQEKELLDLKTLLVKTKREFEDLQFQFQRDLKQLGNQVQEMSTAALGYHKVVKENRNLYNMVQDLKGNIRLYCRIRHIFNAEAKNVVDFIGEDSSLVIVDPSKPHRDGRKVFQFNRVFSPLATQDDVYMDTQPLIRSGMDGYNVCIFAYGQTGSGKTHTMSGPSGELTKHMGINYLALNDLFELSNRRKDIITYDIHVQMVEIYNEQVRDLLAEDSASSRLKIRSCTSDGGLSLPDATMHSVKSTADVVNLMKFGDVNRVVSSTALNNRSSRSHSVLTVHVQGKDVSGSILCSCLHLVDLAGSERVDKSEVTGERLKEAQYINRSVLSGRCYHSFGPEKLPCTLLQ